MYITWLLAIAFCVLLHLMARKKEPSHRGQSLHPPSVHASWRISSNANRLGNGIDWSVYESQNTKRLEESTPATLWPYSVVRTSNEKKLLFILLYNCSRCHSPNFLSWSKSYLTQISKYKKHRRKSGAFRRSNTKKVCPWWYICEALASLPEISTLVLIKKTCIWNVNIAKSITSCKYIIFLFGWI